MVEFDVDGVHYVEVSACCKAPLIMDGCCIDHSEGECSGCGAHLDSRAVWTVTIPETELPEAHFPGRAEAARAALPAVIPTQVGRYRNKPAEVEAICYHPPGNCEAVYALLGWNFSHHLPVCNENSDLALPMIEGDSWLARPGDWIVKASDGAVKISPRGVFAATYEKLVDG